MQGIAGEIGLGPMFQLATVSRAVDVSSNVFMRSHSLAVGLSIPGVLPPCCLRFGGWMYMERRMGEAGG